MVDSSDNLVQVVIYGKPYSIRGKTDSVYIKDVAGFVDSKMREVEDGFRNPQTDTRVAILAAMNISDELFTLRREQGLEPTDSFGQAPRAKALCDLIDESLAEPD
jgi:cell division protein ZapA